jgi:hypothetical protein
MIPLGIPESGTGTAIHSSLGLTERLVSLRYTRPFSEVSETCLVFVLRRLNYQIL